MDDADLVPPPVDAAGLFAGRYRIVRLLGRGGMGVVYQAEDLRLKRFVALKFLAAELSAHAHARTRFLREAQASAGLDDPHVCTVYEAGEDQGRAYIAMAFIDGPTLRDRIAQGPLAIDEAVAIARDVAAGLAAAHARRRRAPGRQTRQRDARRAEEREDHGLRPGTHGGREPIHEDRRRRRHTGLHVARAGAGPADGSAHRHLVVRLRALRDADRPLAVHHGQRPGGCLRDRARAGAGRDGVPARRPGLARRRPRALSRA